jgi:hypothetical protein
VTHRLAPADAPGTLFKRPAPPKRTPRERLPHRNNTDHLEAIRQCPCLACGRDPCGEAAHVRMGTHAGMGRKPEDRWVTPLCRACHADQHEIGELTFWHSLDLPPLTIAAALYRASPNVEAMRAMVFVARFMARDEK